MSRVCTIARLATSGFKLRSSRTLGPASYINQWDEPMNVFDFSHIYMDGCVCVRGCMSQKYHFPLSINYINPNISWSDTSELLPYICIRIDKYLISTSLVSIYANLPIGFSFILSWVVVVGSFRGRTTQLHVFPALTSSHSHSPSTAPSLPAYTWHTWYRFRITKIIIECYKI